MLSADSDVDFISPSEHETAGLRRPPSRIAALDESQRAWLRHRLHDELAQCLTFALIRLDTAREGPPAKRAQALVHARRLVRQSLQVARDTLQGVEVVAGNDALHLGLKRTAVEVMGLSGRRIEIVCPPIVQAVPVPVASTLMRAARELLVNACKHAPGARIRLRAVTEGGSGLTLWVSDDGPGMARGAAREDACRHFGLHRLPEELAASGVKLSIRSRPGHGLCARLRWRPRPHPGGAAEHRSPASGELRG